MPIPLYVDKPIGQCTICEAMTNDSDAKLLPVKDSVKGFRIITRMKIGDFMFHFLKYCCLFYSLIYRNVHIYMRFCDGFGFIIHYYFLFFSFSTHT